MCLPGLRSAWKSGFGGLPLQNEVGGGGGGGRRLCVFARQATNNCNLSGELSARPAHVLRLATLSGWRIPQQDKTAQVVLLVCNLCASDSE
jgi:hypothetical protein